MTSTTDPTEPGAVVIRYQNQSGALVAVSHRTPQSTRLVAYGAQCTGCLDDTDSHAELPDTLGEARRWANRHATECRALPQPEPQV